MSIKFKISCGRDGHLTVIRKEIRNDFYILKRNILPFHEALKVNTQWSSTDPQPDGWDLLF